MRNRLKGLIAATFTPMKADGSLNLDQVGPLADYLVRNQVDGVFVCGSTGEGPLLTMAERKETARAFVQALAGRMPVIVHVGHSSIEEARDLAAHAASIRADAISAVAPWYFKPANVASVVDCLAAIAGAGGDLPFYYYHIPSLTGVNLNIVQVAQRALQRIPNFAGIKYTAPTVDEYQSAVIAGEGKFEVLFGRDEMLLSSLVVGAQAAIGSTYNFAAPLYRRVISAFERGDLATARAEQARAVRMIEIMLGYGGLPAFKLAMSWIGIDCGPSRLPLENLPAEKQAALKNEITAAGYFDWAVK